MLKDNQSIVANVKVGSNSFIVVGTRIIDKRGRYLCMYRTNSRIISIEITDTGYNMETFEGTITQTEYSG